MSGGSSSSTSTTTSNTYTAIDQRVVADGGSSVISNSGGISIGDNSGFSISTTTTDHGAIAAGRDIAIAGLEANVANQAAQLAAMSEAIAGASAVAAQATADSINSANQSMARVVDMGKHSTEFAATSLDSSLQFATMMAGQNAYLIDETTKGVEAAYKTANDMSSGQRVVVLVGLAVVGIAAFMMLRRAPA